jgi:protein SCO1/2
MKRVLCALSLSLFGMLAAVAAPAPALKSGVFEPPRMAPELTLQGSDGNELKLSRFRGKVVLLEFGYTSCTAVCPVSLAMLADARKRLGAAGAEVQVLYVTVDPERDTVSRMRRYLAKFDPGFIGATGSAEQLARVRRDYGVSVTEKMPGASKNDYTIGHSSFLYLIDRQGQLRSLMPFGRSAADIVHDVTLLLKK